MAIRGQLLELRNLGSFQFHLKVGVYEDEGSVNAVETAPEEGLPLDRPLEIYDCRIDFSDPEKPVSYPEGRLEECLSVYEKNESPETLSPPIMRQWKVGFIVDTLLAEAFSTDLLEVIFGEDYQNTDAGADDGATEKSALLRQCPDCGANAGEVLINGLKTGVCEICGRHFPL
ncbi:MAG: hypothetical protein A2293_15290 [Elusimicrobia bacterium RIFOXYB2_FULL_49_7]|nr:MAG: hypothetical protein A2293_15290 [Elusimicrobia bacterium RIFOXYB2_FULL_49_7]